MTILSTSPEAIQGKTLLLAFIRTDVDRHILSQEQFLSEITEAEQNKLTYTRTDGRQGNLPYVKYSLQVASRGIYILASSGEEILDPDFLSIWELTDDKSPDGSFRIRPVHPDPFISNLPQQWKFEYRYDEFFLHQLIQETGHGYLGKSIIIGINDIDSKKQRQVFGRITNVSFEHGIVVSLSEGGVYVLPPDITYLKSAPPGEYRFRSNGMIIQDPDYLVFINSSKTQPSIRK